MDAHFWQAAIGLLLLAAETCGSFFLSFHSFVEHNLHHIPLLESLQLFGHNHKTVRPGHGAQYPRPGDHDRLYLAILSEGHPDQAQIAGLGGHLADHSGLNTLRLIIQMSHPLYGRTDEKIQIGERCHRIAGQADHRPAGHVPEGSGLARLEADPMHIKLSHLR